MKFFFDNNFSPNLVNYLKNLNLEEEENHVLEHLRDSFDPSTHDEKWIAELSKKGKWVIISSDLRMATNPKIRKVLEESGLTIFFFPKSFPRMNRWEQSWRTIKIWPDIMKKAASRPTGHTFKITGAWNKIQD